MSLSNLIERSSPLLIKIGMPLVYFYHLIISSTFWNVAAEDAYGLEKWANYALTPVHYLFEGRKAILVDDDTYQYRLERRFQYDHSFYLKTAASVTSLPLSITIGGTLKSLALLFPETKKRYLALDRAVHKNSIISHRDFYQSIGLDITPFTEGILIDPPKFKKRPGETAHFEPELKALKAIVSLLHKHQIPFWVDCGTCLGAYRYGAVIPWDWDIDLAVLSNDFDNVKAALLELDPHLYVVQDWSGRELPKTYLKVYVKENHSLIDIYHFRIDAEHKQLGTILSNENNIFLPTSWKIREKRYTVPMPFDRVFPLKKALFEGIEVPVPGKIEEYLQTFYGENLNPPKIYNEATGQYEKDLSHPYWQLPYAH